MIVNEFIKIIKNYAQVKMKNLKKVKNNYFSMKSSLEHLMDTSTNFYLIPMEIQDIINGKRNEMRFRMSIVNLIYVLFFLTLNAFLFSSSNYLFSIIKFDLMPDQTRELIFSFGFASLWCFPAKIDLILGEIKSKLSSFKIFYYLINDLKSKHKLTDVNFNRLAILSRIIQIIVLDVGMPIALILNFILISFIAISTQKLVWVLQSIFYIPAIVNFGMICSTWMCFVFVIFMYYKFRFDQINQQIKTIIPNGKVINKRREKCLMKLINEHNLTSIEVCKISLMIRRTAAATFFLFSIIKVCAFYFLINFDNIFIKIMTFDIAITILSSSFVLSYLFTQQIRSAHKSYKFIHSFVCNYKMRSKFKFKVNK